MELASICSLPPINETSASSPRTSNNNNSVDSPKNTSTLPPISSLLHPISEKTPSTHHENSTLLAQPYLQTKPNSVQLSRLEPQKNSPNNSPSLLNLHSLSLESSTRLQSSQVHPSPPPTTPSLSRSNSNIPLNEQRSPSIHPSLNALTPDSRPSPPESVASLSKSSPSLNNREPNVLQQQQQSSYSENSSQTYQPQPPQWQRQHSQHSQISPSNQQNVVVDTPSKDTKQDPALQQRQKQQQQQQRQQQQQQQHQQQQQQQHQQQQQQQQQQHTMQYNAAVTASGLPSEYHYYRASFEKDVYQSVTRGTERTMVDLKKIIDHCAIIGQFAAQYGEICSRNANNRPDVWPMQPTIPIGLPTEGHVSEMINKAFDVLYVLNDLKDEASRRGPSEIDLIRHKRSSAGVSPTRPKYRKRTKRPAPPGRCHSCNIQETPEWRRGPDGARTLCNACGLHFAKLTRKRAQNAIQEQQQRIAQQRTFLHHPYPHPHPYMQMTGQNQNALKLGHYPGFPQFPQHNAGGGNQLITTTSSSMVTQTQSGYSTATRIEID